LLSAAEIRVFKETEPSFFLGFLTRFQFVKLGFDAGKFCMHFLPELTQLVHQKRENSGVII
jgi:hypothetical protein